MLGMAFDSNHDIATPLFDLIDIEDPIIIYEMFFIIIKRLKKHISLIFDFIVD